jgi:hypothetical protein
MHLLLNYVPNAVSTHAFSPPAEFYRPKSQGSCSEINALKYNLYLKLDLSTCSAAQQKRKKYEQVKRSNLDYI